MSINTSQNKKQEFFLFSGNNSFLQIIGNCANDENMKKETKEIDEKTGLLP